MTFTNAERGRRTILGIVMNGTRYANSHARSPMLRSALAASVMLLLVGCALPTPSPSPLPDASRPSPSPAPTATPSPSEPSVRFNVDCGPLAADPGSCASAVKVALGPTSSAAAALLTFRIEAPSADGTCPPLTTECRRPSVIVYIYQGPGGTTIGQVPLIQSGDSWVPLSMIR